MKKPKSERYAKVHAALTRAGRPSHVAHKVATRAHAGKRGK